MRIEVPQDVQNYLLRYGRRDMASLLAALEQLKDAAFAGKRRITVPLARPRTVADTASETFAALKLEILNLIRH